MPFISCTWASKSQTGCVIVHTVCSLGNSVHLEIILTTMPNCSDSTSSSYSAFSSASALSSFCSGRFFIRFYKWKRTHTHTHTVRERERERALLLMQISFSANVKARRKKKDERIPQRLRLSGSPIRAKPPSRFTQALNQEYGNDRGFNKCHRFQIVLEHSTSVVLLQTKKARLLVFKTGTSEPIDTH